MSNPVPRHLTVLTGASRGMGRAMAEQLLAAGHVVLTLARHESPALAEQAAGHGTPLTQWTVDLADGASIDGRLREWLDAFPADHFASATLINNAGVIPPIVPLRDSQAPDLQQALRVGLEAPLLLTAAFLDATRDWTGRRRVLNISSGLGRRPMASQSAYCAAKAGMDLFTRCLALDEAREANGARVCSLAPGVIDTDMQVQLRGADATAFPDRASFEQLKQGGVLSSPQDAARRILAYLERSDFGAHPVADIRDAAP
ncbi:MAG TPA: SDR family NAD(P)-dependent oxidoreductase [Ottowia sp.]|uniref:SDR family NAD(P)-dependent oxidoreductase n=1 Tax=Ottowia sp. TaxID=1898956 RepID=UPI002C0D0370|nr:SDR family NAD(P)-dependent oxidoreductase [Ottowia sp.]HMN20620.1 SDR family NAD(P)-dependent oxidoreductase [Ottowia sp.]